MVTPQLADYIKNQRDKSVTDFAIRTELLNKGWHEEDIEKGLLDLESQSNQTVGLQGQLLDPSNLYGRTENQPTLNRPESILVPKPKSINILSNLLIILALTYLSGAFAGVAVLLILNHGMMAAIPGGGLEFSGLKAMPFLGLISLPGIFSFPLISLAALRVRSGSRSAWNFGLIVVVVVIVAQIITGYLTVKLVNPIYQATSTF